MGYKLFTSSTLTSSDVNTYLMRQSVMVFASAGVRASQLLGPTEGMVSYLEDTNVLEIYDGSSWVGITTSNLTGNTSVRANTTHADGGSVLRAWTANSAYTGLATNGMTGQEYVVISDGTDAFLSGGLGGTVGVRAPINDPANSLAVSSSGVSLNGRVTTATQPYMQAKGQGSIWTQPPAVGTPLRNGSPAGFSWATVYNVGSHFNTSTGLFTAPVSGVYLCIFKTYQQNYGGTGWIHWMFSVGGTVSWNGGEPPYNIYGYNSGNYADGVDVAAMIYVTAGNGIGIEGHMGGDERFYSNYTYFSIRLLG